MTEKQRPTAGELEDWVATVSRALGLPDDHDVDIAAILDLARDVAHGVARPAAPLTTFLVGYAAGLQGGGEETVQRLADAAATLAIGDSPSGDSHSEDPPGTDPSEP